MRKPFLGYLLYFFINYVAISAFCLRGKSFNEDRNHHQCTIGTALIGIVGKIFESSFLINLFGDTNITRILLNLRHENLKREIIWDE